MSTLFKILLAIGTLLFIDNTILMLSPLMLFTVFVMAIQPLFGNYPFTLRDLAVFMIELLPIWQHYLLITISLSRNII